MFAKKVFVYDELTKTPSFTVTTFFKNNKFSKIEKLGNILIAILL